MSEAQVDRRSPRWPSLLLVFGALGLGGVALRAAGTHSVPTGPPTILLTPSVPIADGTQLQIVAARPVGAAERGAQIAVTFSRPVVALQSAQELARRIPALLLEPPVEGSWSWLGSATLEFVPTALLPLDTRFSVTVPAGIESLDGARLEQPYRFEFATPGPRLYRTEPLDGDRWVAPQQPFALWFDQPVRDIASRVAIDVEGGERIALRLDATVDVAAEEAAQRASQPSSFDWSEPARGQPDVRTRYLLVPARPLPFDRPLTLWLDPDLMPARRTDADQIGSGAGEFRSPRFRTWGAFRVLQAGCGYSYSAVCPYGPLRLLFSNPVEVESLRERLTLDPPVAIDWQQVEQSRSGDALEVVLPGDFRPGVTHRVTLAAGARDQFGQAADLFSGTIRTDDLAPELFVERDRMLIEAEGDGVVPLRTVNLATVDAAIWKVTPQELARLACGGWSRQGPNWPSGAPRPIALDVAGARNATRFSPLALRATRQERFGLYVLRLASAQLIAHDGRRQPAQRVLAQLTDLAVHAKLGPVSGMVWVTRLSTGEPAGGASIGLYDANGKELFTGATDDDGVLALPGLAAQAGTARWVSTPSVLVAARLADDVGVALSDWDEAVSPWSYGLPGGWDGSGAESLGFVSPERGIYRPGSAVELFGVARYRLLGRLRRPEPGTHLTLELNDPRGRTVVTEQLTVGPLGNFSAHVTLPSDAPLGTWWIGAEGQTPDGQALRYDGTLRVEEYRAPQFLVDLRAPRPAALAGERLDAVVSARTAFGAAMAGAGLEWSALRRTTAFQPPGWDDFEFGNQLWWWDDSPPQERAEVTASGRGTVERSGEFAIDAGIADTPGERTYVYTIEAEVSDVDRQRAADRSEVLAHPAAAYGGVRSTTTGFATEGREHELQLIATTPEGALVGGLDLTLQIAHRSWKSIRRKGLDGRWEFESEPVEEPVATCRVRSAEQPVPCRFTPATPGLYVLDLRLRDAAGRTQRTRSGLYVVGSGWVAWQQDGDDRVDLVLDRRSYEPGDTARLLVKSPYPEAEALLTIEREGVLSSRRVKLQGASTALSIPIEERFIPNVFVSVVLVRGRVAQPREAELQDDPGRPAFRIGYLELPVEKRRLRLDAQLSLAKDTYRPREVVEGALTLRDSAGRPVMGEATVWAVDETVLRLTAYRPPDPVEALHPRRDLSTRVAESMINLIRRRWFGEKGLGAPGGGGGPDGGVLRRLFETTPYFAARVATGTDGVAPIRFTLPDNLTTYRLMAVAIDAQDRGGTAETKLVVTKPLLLRPSLPRLARSGDRFEAGVVVHRTTGEQGPVEVAVQVDGPLTLEGESQRRVELPEGRGREVRFAFLAGTPGRSTLRFSVRSGTQRDAVEQQLTIRAAARPETVTTYGSTSAAVREQIQAPTGDDGKLTLTLSSSMLAGFEGAIRQLVDYPYGCAEQLASQLVPFVALDQLQSAFAITPERAPDVGRTEPDAVVKQALAGLARLQRADGGLALWSASSCSHPAASAWGLVAVWSAQEAGYPIPEDLTAGLQRFLTEQVATGTTTSCGVARAVDPETRLLGLWALARSGRPLGSYYRALHEDRTRLSLFGRALLLDLWLSPGGDRATGQALLTELMAAAHESAGEIHFQETDAIRHVARWSSDTRTTALALLVLSRHAPAHPYVPKLVRWLASRRDRSGGYRNTQESAWVLLAMAALLPTIETEPPDFDAVVVLDQRELARRPFHRRSLEQDSLALPVPKGGAAGPLELRAEGRGVLHYTVQLQSTPRSLPVEPLDRGLIVQRWLEPLAGGAPVEQLRAGSLVVLRVRVATPAARHDVVVDLPLPAGLEAVDSSLAIGAKNRNQAEEATPADDAERWTRSFYSPFVSQELRDDRVVVFADELPVGVHELSFVLRATTPGRFVFAPGFAAEMYTPETFGRTAASSITVRP